MFKKIETINCKDQGHLSIATILLHRSTLMQGDIHRSIGREANLHSHATAKKTRMQCSSMIGWVFTQGQLGNISPSLSSSSILCKNSSFEGSIAVAWNSRCNFRLGEYTLFHRLSTTWMQRTWCVEQRESTNFPKSVHLWTSHAVTVFYERCFSPFCFIKSIFL